MPIVKYNPGYFEKLQEMVGKLERITSFSHRPFVDYYYTTSDWCDLFLYIDNKDDIVGTLGVDKLRFEFDSREMIIGFGNNFFSLKPGPGGILFMKWLNTCSYGGVLGGSENFHRIISRQKWVYYKGIKTLLLNRKYNYLKSEVLWRKGAKLLLNFSRNNKINKLASRIPYSIRKRLSLEEVEEFSEDMVRIRSPFVFRFSPMLEYLKWRYSTHLSFVRYRIFKIFDSDRLAGFAVFNESPEKILIAHCDGNSPSMLGYGVLLALSKLGEAYAKQPEVELVSCNPKMQKIFRSSGFREIKVEKKFALGALKKEPDIPTDTSNWLVNIDWNDNGLRSPFLDQKIPAVNY